MILQFFGLTKFNNNLQDSREDVTLIGEVSTGHPRHTGLGEPDDTDDTHTNHSQQQYHHHSLIWQTTTGSLNGAVFEDEARET